MERTTSLRPPQRDSLESLSRVCEFISLARGATYPPGPFHGPSPRPRRESAGSSRPGKPVDNTLSPLLSPSPLERAYHFRRLEPWSLRQFPHNGVLTRRGGLRVYNGPIVLWRRQSGCCPRCGSLGTMGPSRPGSASGRHVSPISFISTIGGQSEQAF